MELGGHFVDLLFKLRPVRSDGFGGNRPVDWSEIYAFSKSTRYVSEPWELVLLSEMAISYLEGMVEGKNPFSIPPVEQEQNG